MIRRLLPALALLVSGCNERAPDPARPEGYAASFAVEPAKGDALQRVELPAAAVIAFRKADLTDLRLFDSTGRAMPVALLEEAPAQLQPGPELKVFPIVGTPAALRAAGVSIRLDAGGQARLVEIDGRSSGAPSGSEVVGALIDSRAAAGALAALELDVDLPVGRPVTVTAEASTDLRNWHALGEKTLFRPGEDPALLGDRRIALDGASLNNRYVRVTWDLPAGVAVRAARTYAEQSGTRPPLAIVLTGQVASGPREVLLTLPFAMPLSGLRIAPGQGDSVVPVTLAARGSPEEPWTPLLKTTLRRGDTRDLALGRLTARQLRLSADPRTAGFASPPVVQALLPATTLAGQFDGTPPYRLAVGNAAAPPAYLTAREIAGDGAAAGLAVLPLARVKADPAGPVDVSPGQSGQDRRTWVLWGVLLLGTLVLGLAALRLMRAASAAKTPDAEEGAGGRV